ncbi:MAG: hypothetical protein JWO40_44 [Candidatus Doudnabacteria bacterium]|nr:hypothetical protein [Candidatus Doudnabacteria bacterium]
MIDPTPNSLNNQIVKTLEYFNVQDHPLTLLEIYKYLLNVSADNKQATLLEIQQILPTLSEVEHAKGFYFLKGRAEIAKRRLENNYYSTFRLKRAKKYLPRVRFVPFVNAVALTGSEAINNSKQGSDIDLLVLTAPGRIWTARLFLTAYFQIFGVRRHGKFVENRFCLNHYVQNGKNVGRERHVYTAVEYVSLIPFYGADQIYKFQQNNLEWIKNYLIQPQLVKYPDLATSRVKVFMERLLHGKVGDYLEKLIGKMQQSRIHIQDSIVIEPDELSFHPGNKGRQILERVPFKI